VRIQMTGTEASHEEIQACRNEADFTFQAQAQN
jgi:hypothetical protein